MKIIKRELDNFDNIEIIPISDTHIGDKCLNKQLLKKTLEYIKNTPNCYCILNGDLCNIALKNSVSDVYAEEIPPMEQLSQLCLFLDDIKEKILVVCDGNHERRITKETGISIIQLACKQLKIEDRYASGRWYIYLYFGEKNYGVKRKMCYTITGFHGSGGGSTYGGAVNQLMRQKQVVIADLYIMSHFHKRIATSDIVYMPDYSNAKRNGGQLIKKECCYLLSNSFLEYDNSYAENMNLVPSGTKVTKAILNGRERNIDLVI